MKNKDLDNFFKSRSHSLDEMPSDDLWKKIQNNLSLEPKPKITFKITFYTMVLPIIALITIASLLNNSNAIKSDKTVLNNGSVKKEKPSLALDSNIQLKPHQNVLEVKKTITTKNIIKTKNTITPVIEKNDIQVEEASNIQEKIYSINEVEIKPEYPGDINRLYVFIYKKLRMPKECPGGKITVTFVIEKDGTLTDIKTIKDIGFGAGDEAVRVLKESLKWEPGKQDGKVVRVQYTLPITIQATANLEEDNLVYNMAGINVKPEFIGGKEKLYEFIYRKYRIRKDCPEGKIYLSFIIEKNGSLSSFQVIKDIGFGSGEEAIRVLKDSPLWEPGEQNGKKVRVLYNLPITISRDAEE